MDDQLPSSPAAQRNIGPLAIVLRDILPATGNVLEIASGTGEHCEAFARKFPDLSWQPTDADPASVEWISARRERSGLANIEAPVLLDAALEAWPEHQADAILCINMVHISPWTATQGLIRGSSRTLSPGAPLILYGPYRRSDVPTAPSNDAFDQSLRARNSEWGLRELDKVIAEAENRNFGFERLFEMPANNLTLVFRRL